MPPVLPRRAPRSSLALALATVAALAGACSAATTSPTGSEAAASPTPGGLPDRDAALAHRLVEQEHALLLDVRTPEEFADGHIPGAVNIPYTEIDERIAEINTLVGADPSKPIVVYCRSGRRSGIAKQSLLAHDFPQVTNLGGMTDW